MSSDARSPSGCHTIGVAVAIPAPWAEELQRCRESFGDPQAWSIPTHVTLLPPTRIDDRAMPEVEDHLRKIADDEQVFPMELCGTASFQPVSPVVFVEVRVGARISWVPDEGTGNSDHREFELLGLPAAKLGVGAGGEPCRHTACDRPGRLDPVSLRLVRRIVESALSGRP